jgi:hypothetical protein
MVAAKRASRPTATTPLRTKIVAIVTSVASFRGVCLAPDTFARCLASDTFPAHLGKA